MTVSFSFEIISFVCFVLESLERGGTQSKTRADCQDPMIFSRNVLLLLCVLNKCISYADICFVHNDHQYVFS